MASRRRDRVVAMPKLGRVVVADRELLLDIDAYQQFLLERADESAVCLASESPRQRPDGAMELPGTAADLTRFLERRPEFDLPSRLLYRDALMLILDKPSGIAVHRAGKGGRSLEDGFEALRFGLPRRPALAHRLDRDTSGCLVLGRHPEALRRLSVLFARGHVDKVYWALVEGDPPAEEGRTEHPLARIGWKSVPDAAGQHSVTLWRVLGRGSGLAWIEARPLTGRMHQIRAHLAAIGLPILGDAVYGHGRGAHAGDIVMLHARSVSVPLHPKRPPIVATAEPPMHMWRGLSVCGWSA